MLHPHEPVSRQPVTPVWLVASFIALGLTIGLLSLFGQAGSSSRTQPLTIATANLPDAVAGQEYHATLRAKGAVRPVSWRIYQGKLPVGLTLAPATGAISGIPRSTGPFEITVVLRQEGTPPTEVQRSYGFKVDVPLAIRWNSFPKVQGNSIVGDVVVTNNTDQPGDLTVIVLAVNEVGKATALGYQHFTVSPKSSTPLIPFASSLPGGKYVIHADAVAEVESNNSIYRARQQTPSPLNVQQE
jgi:hypothetical protein